MLGSPDRSRTRNPKSTSNLRPFFTFLYATACRLDAAMNLTWGNISEDLSILEIPSSATKNKQLLRLPLSGKLLEPVVKELQKQFRNVKLPLFDSSNYRTEWAIACAKAGVGTWTRRPALEPVYASMIVAPPELSICSPPALTKGSCSRSAVGRHDPCWIDTTLGHHTPNRRDGEGRHTDRIAVAGMPR